MPPVNGDEAGIENNKNRFKDVLLCIRDMSHLVEVPHHPSPRPRVFSSSFHFPLDQQKEEERDLFRALKGRLSCKLNVYILDE